MSRWDTPEFDSYDKDEESRLMRKFYDYAEIEKKESERKRFLEVSDKKRPSTWGNRFVFSAIIQGAIVTGLTVALILMQVAFSDTSLIQFLSLDGPAKWFFFGYFMYITLVVSIAITAIFYNHLESNLGKSISPSKKYLVWTQLIGMNVGGAGATILLIVTGFVGTGFISYVSGQESLMPNLIGFVKIPVSGFTLLFAAGIIAGGIAYISTFLNFQKNQAKIEEMKFDRL
jgi:hypothetical protein